MRPGTPPATPKKGGAGKTLLLAGGGIAAGVAVVAAVGGDPAPAPAGEVRFSGARFATPAIDCPNGVVDQPLPVGLDVDATNPGPSATLSAVSSTLIIVARPPSRARSASPAPPRPRPPPRSVPRGTTTLRLQTTLRCSNGTGDEPRFNEWSGRVVLATAAGAVTLETVDRLRVNIP